MALKSAVHLGKQNEVLYIKSKYNFLKMMTQVYNKNLINVDGSNISLQLRKRRESARHMRHALLSEDPRRRNTASAGGLSYGMI